MSIRKKAASAIFFILLNYNLGFAQKGLYLSIFGMPQRTFMYNRPDNNADVIAQSNFFPAESRDIIRNPTYNFSFGFLLKQSIAKRFLFCYGLQYSPIEQSYHTFVKVRNEDVPGRIRLNYLRLPVLLQYNYAMREGYSLFVSGGVQVSALLSDQGAIPVYYKSYPIFDLIDAGSAYRDFTFDGVLSTGVESILYKNTSFFVQARFDYSFTRAEKESFQELNVYTGNVFEYPNVTIRSAHNISLGIAVGLILKIK